MVSSATSLTGNGLRDWLYQRVSALVLAVYTLFIMGFIMTRSMDYAAWVGLFHHTGVKIFSVLAALSLLVHAWVGVWTILTDYIKMASLRLSLEIVVILALLFYFIWAIIIVWSV